MDRKHYFYAVPRDQISSHCSWVRLGWHEKCGTDLITIRLWPPHDSNPIWIICFITQQAICSVRKINLEDGCSLYVISHDSVVMQTNLRFCAWTFLWHVSCPQYEYRRFCGAHGDSLSYNSAQVPIWYSVERSVMHLWYLIGGIVRNVVPTSNLPLTEKEGISFSTDVPWSVENHSG